MNTTIVPTDLCIQNDDQSYDLEMHGISVFVILITSLLGASISVVSSRMKGLRINPIIINMGKFVGSG